MSQQNPGPDIRPPDELTVEERLMDPFPWYETMRETEPVRYDESRDCWDVFRYDDVKRALSDYETFTSTGASDFDPNGNLGTLLIDEDPPEHDRLRGVVESTSSQETSRSFARRFDRSSTTASIEHSKMDGRLTLSAI